jgi:hypothetical protein
VIISTAVILIRAADRLMTVTATEEPDSSWILADCRDLATGIESQAIVDDLDPEEYTADSILADQGMRDCIKSVYLGATTAWKAHKIAAPGLILPDDYPLKIISVTEKRA